MNENYICETLIGKNSNSSYRLLSLISKFLFLTLVYLGFIGFGNSFHYMVIVRRIITIFGDIETSYLFL